ncbi:GNAT family N-acetyltransferase [Bhargavaea beijingensis]|uniref:GNAT family N-acetyltransferase n=1 Tax=Bhargavaea beijingensis TaxID=426756 RepID=A0A1G6Y664_9BACL|nr:GNAT family N-acetyltransferase [Bhargavaea beijingensis]MCW1927854.1 GNAT family N-acetyltransferase [Bhargavaea beijingensis]RSK31901.1 GNAT family N-acetyltransferase [Bhargavaea beijingensis]SDD85197.1 Protein N-acetyltransferase, RimJ/RimL family [Bhargavaea beijingensis]
MSRNVREAVPSDADGLLKAMASAEDSGMMLFGPGERRLTMEQAERMIGNFREDPASALFVAEGTGGIAGYLIARGEGTGRTRHRAYVVIGVHHRARGKGTGTALFRQLDGWARERGLRRLELTVIAENMSAVALYRKMGFDVEGVKRDSLVIDGRYADEYYMAKILE